MVKPKSFLKVYLEKKLCDHNKTRPESIFRLNDYRMNQKHRLINNFWSSRISTMLQVSVQEQDSRIVDASAKTEITQRRKESEMWITAEYFVHMKTL